MPIPSSLLALLDDPDLLLDAPLACWHAGAPVLRRGGVAILPWRGDAMAAGTGIESRSDASDIIDNSYEQSVVITQKQRLATLADLADAWRVTAPGGRVVVVGSNAHGIKSTVKRVGQLVEDQPHSQHSRYHARLALFIKTERPFPPPPIDNQVPLQNDCPDLLLSRAGVFSWDGLDAGTALLQQHFTRLVMPRRLADLGAGIGHLCLAALRHWPTALADAYEADARALACLQHNSQARHAADRCAAHWWDAGEALARDDYDLILCNPPCHAEGQTRYTTTIAEAMFHRAAEHLSGDGHLLVVANRQLPYEKYLSGLFESWSICDQNQHFKILDASQPRRPA